MSVLEKLKNAGPTTSIVYHFGYDLRGASKIVLQSVRNFYDNGTVDLVQRRKDGRFEYIVQFRRQHAKIDPVNTFKAASTAI